jgi:hypothetical protein
MKEQLSTCEKKQWQNSRTDWFPDNADNLSREVKVVRGGGYNLTTTKENYLTLQSKIKDSEWAS